jgi:hypothetical protein
MDKELNSYSRQIDNIFSEINDYKSKLNLIEDNLKSIHDTEDISKKGDLSSYKSVIEQKEKELQEILNKLNLKLASNNTKETLLLINKIQDFIHKNNFVAEYSYHFDEKVENTLLISGKIKNEQLIINDEVNAQTKLLENTHTILDSLKKETVSGLERFNHALMNTSKTKLYITIGLEVFLCVLLLI